jgi:hypothetical protein
MAHFICQNTTTVASAAADSKLRTKCLMRDFFTETL